MRFLLDAEQRAFAASLDALLTAAGTPGVVREWSRGDHASGQALWSRLAQAGVFALAVPEAYEGLGPRPVELAVAFVELGRHAVPGPLVETVTAAVLLTGADPGTAERLLPALASGGTMATVAPPDPAERRGQHREPAPQTALEADETHRPHSAQGPRPQGPDKHQPHLAQGQQPQGQHRKHPPQIAQDETHRSQPEQGRKAQGHQREPAPHRAHAPDRTHQPLLFALDGDVAALRLACAPDGVRRSPGHGPVRPSLDPARRLTPLAPGGELLVPDPPMDQALTWARLATAAQALGVGLALLDRTVGYVGQRRQFGVPVGSFQAVKHRLADAKIALEFARPLVFGAALTMCPADVAAAKVAACEAAYTTARTALQLHGAIGYTAEYGLSMWLAKARALRTAWGGPEECRALVVSGGDRRW